MSSLNYRIDISSITTFDEWFTALKSVTGYRSNNQSWVFTTVSFICWEIRKIRCNCIFNWLNPTPEISAIKASWAASEFLCAILHQGNNDLPTPQFTLSHHLSWSPLPVGILKANFDGAWSKENFQSGLGVIFRSSTSFIVAGMSKPCLSSSALQGEAKAILLVVTKAIENGFLDVVFESDSQELISNI